MSEQCWLVQERENPSTDFFVLPELARQKLDCEPRLLQVVPAAEEEAAQTLVFVRYLTPAWRQLVERQRDRIGRLVFFMDDDLFDLRAHAGLPLRYRWKLFRLAWRHRRWLQRMGAELWLSSDWLAQKYAHWQPQLLTPASPYGDSPGAAGGPQKTVFYHGSASHSEDIRWLRPVIAAVLERDPQLSFEIIGDLGVRSLFAGLPRVHVVHPMQWPAYRAFIRRPGRTIGLAPLLHNSFNRARSATKFYDITAAGAVGIYADNPVYGGRVHHGVNGLLLPMEPQAWVEAILQLSQDAVLRQSLLARARACR